MKDRDRHGDRDDFGRLSSDEERRAEAADAVPDAAPCDRSPRIMEGEPGSGGAPFDPQLEDDLGAELEMVREQAARHLDTAQRIQAEFENYRKRAAREQAEAGKRAGERLVQRLLPVLDNLERAVDHTTVGGEVEDLRRGVEMVYVQVLQAISEEGAEKVDPFGQPFDPSLHKAVMQREDHDVPDGTVVEVFQNGYVMGGRVLRPATVVVSTGGPHRSEE